MIDIPDVPPAVVQVVDGLQGQHAARAAGLIDGSRSDEVITVHVFGPMTVTTTPGIADQYAHRPAGLVSNVGEAESDGGVA